MPHTLPARWLLWFVPNAARADARLSQRYQGIAAALLFISFVTLFIPPVFLLLNGAASAGMWVLLLGPIVIPVAGAAYIRFSANITHGLLLTNFAAIVLVAAWAWVSGGILSFALPWLIANLSLLLTFGNASILAGAGGMVLATLAGLYLAQRAGLLPPSYFAAAVLPEMATLAYITSALLVIGAAWVISRQRAAVKLRLREALERAEIANKTKSVFLSSMSHEFRTPLSTVLGFAEVLREDSSAPLTPLQQDYVGHILTAAEHLNKLVKQLLEMARLEAGEIEISVGTFDAERVVRAALAMTELEANSRQVAVTFDAPEQPLHVIADSTRVLQVLINLLSNAITFNRPGGSAVVRVRAVDAGASSTSGSNGTPAVRFEVEDDGPGIPAELHAQLFVAFARLGAESGNIAGSGLGLAISKRLVSMMGGEVGFSSVAGQGTLIWFEVPGK